VNPICRHKHQTVGFGANQTQVVIPFIQEVASANAPTIAQRVARAIEALLLQHRRPNSDANFTECEMLSAAPVRLHPAPFGRLFAKSTYWMASQR
jgi:hypothetical protein